MKFNEEIQNHLIDFKENKQYLPASNEKKWEYLEVTDNLYPPIRHGFMQYASDEAIAFHDFARHIRSSQIFCFNLFYPLIKENKMQNYIAQKFALNVDELYEWHFEYQPQQNYLGEWKGSQKPINYITSVDLTIFIKSGNKKIAFLFEVKFTEESFSECGGFNSNGNKNKDYCVKNFDVNIIQQECYLIAKKSRQYYNLTRTIYPKFPPNFCPFAKNNQCQRNHSFAKALMLNRIVEEAYFGLVFHDKNTCIQTHWNNYKNFCSPLEQQYLFEIKASDLVSVSNDKTYKRYFYDRYLI